PIQVQLLLDGVPFSTTAAALPRDDLRSRGLSDGLGGFQFLLPPYSPSDKEVVECRVQSLGGVTLLSGTCSVILPRRPTSSGAPFNPRVLPGARDVAIIIPIYRASEDLADCLESVVSYTTRPARLILVDDNSADIATST